MKIVGVIPVKENSNRFPNKNIAELQGKPLFIHAVSPLVLSEYVTQVYVPTNSKTVKNYLLNEKNEKIKIIHRGINISQDNDPLLSVLKYVHYTIDSHYDAMAVIMANCPGHDVDYVNKAIKLFIETNSKEFRSFNNSGVENGFFIFSKEIIDTAVSISSYLCALTNNGEEIHFKHELEKLKQNYIP